MKPETTEDVFELLDGYLLAPVLGAALELGLFWRLADKPLTAPEIAQSLNIPLNRCHNWLELLCKLGLLDEGAAGYVPSSVARQAILDAYSQDTWAFLAREDRARFPAVRDLAVNLSQPNSTWGVQGLTPPDYFKQIVEDAGYAARFTRMLYELHIPLAQQAASLLDLQGASRLLDLGGGSGVMSFALLRKYPELTAVVVDVENVCRAGRAIAAENGLEQRITYLAVDFMQADVPTGFDAALLCDSGPLNETLFRKIRAALQPDGQLVIITQFAPSQTQAPQSHLLWTFLSSLEYPAERLNFLTCEQVQTRLRQAGFRDFSTMPIPFKEPVRWNIDWILLTARI